MSLVPRWTRRCIAFNRVIKRQIRHVNNVKYNDEFLNHREIGKRQELFMIHPYSPGSIFFLPHGTRIFNKLLTFIKHQQNAHGFNEVITPILFKKDLWIQSGHWDVYKEDMFRIGEEYAIKPMNCPGHCLIYASSDKSYRELPVRLSDFSPLHRNEPSGSLTGLTRVRNFHQDDGHIFCRLDQIKNEIHSCLELIDQVYKKFGFNSYKLFLSTRPDKYIGNIKDWELAESNLCQVLKLSGKSWSINDKDGAFYGPKIDIIVKDKMGKEHQTATIQLDFQLPTRFDLKFKSNDDLFKRPVMIHRAIFGSIERFLAILLESTQGKLPFWLSPRQVMIIPISTDNHGDYAKTVESIMQSGSNNDKKETFYIDIDQRSEPVSKRIREAINKGYTFVAIVGDQEMTCNKVSLRKSSEKNLTLCTPQDAYKMFTNLQSSYQ